MSKSISRRRFLGTTAAVSAATFLPAVPAFAASEEITVWQFGGTPQEVEVWAQRNNAFNAAKGDIDLKYSCLNGQMRNRLGMQKVRGSAQPGEMRVTTRSRKVELKLRLRQFNQR